MRFVDEFREPELISTDRRGNPPPGRHRAALPHHGSLRRPHARHLSLRPEGLLPENIELIHGPGCPVCVLPMGRIDDGLSIAQQPDVIFAAFGDMMRVPGTPGQPARAQGPRHGRPHRLLALRRAEAGPAQSRQARHVLRHRLRDHRALDRADADARQGRGHPQLLGVLQSRHHHSRDPGDSRFARHAPRCLHRSGTCLDRDRLPALRVDCARTRTSRSWSPASSRSTCCSRSSCCCAS